MKRNPIKINNNKKKIKGNCVNSDVLISLTCIDTDKRALGDVVKATDAPALVLGLEELQTHLQAVLHQPIGAHLGVAAAALITLVDPA